MFLDRPLNLGYLSGIVFFVKKAHILMPEREAVNPV